MPAYSPSYLDRLNLPSHNVARFITRQVDIPVSTDRKATVEALTPLHEQVVQASGIEPKMIRRAQQVHGNKIALVGDIGCSFPVAGVDGLVCTHNADCCLAIYVADCAAVWIYDEKIGTRALVHSGKAGTEQNIVQQAINAMKKFAGTDPADCVAVISPCIRPPHFEVDIAAGITQQLLDAGLNSENIIDSGLDTASDLNEFYSYRVEKGNTGRMLALFGRTPHEWN